MNLKNHDFFMVSHGRILHLSGLSNDKITKNSYFMRSTINFLLAVRSRPLFVYLM